MTKQSKYHYDYKQEELSIRFHEGDDVLKVIEIPQPKLEDWYSEILGRKVERDEALTFVDGYGIEPTEQVFTHQVMPEKLRDIYEVVFAKKRVRKGAKYKEITDVTQEDIYEEIEANSIYYEDEIIWIKKQIKRSYVGYWFFSNGTPTYLDGDNYFFLNFWFVDNPDRPDGLPEYRKYQRDMHAILEYARTTTDEFYKYRIYYRDKEGKLVDSVFNNYTEWKLFGTELRNKGIDYGEQSGEFWRKNKEGKRTVAGVNFISARRIAKTDISCCKLTKRTITTPSQLFIIQGLNEDQAIEKVFEPKIQIQFNRLPFFFRPYVKGKDEGTKKGFVMQYDGEMISAYRAGVIPQAMRSRIRPLSSQEKAADGERIDYAYRDEPGKVIDERSKPIDISKWWYNTVLPAMMLGSDIVGFCVMPTTIGNMETGGGSQFLDIVNDSHFHERNDNGTTQSKLINVFMSGYYAIPLFIDRYGNTVIEDPEKPIESIKKGRWITQGAKSWHKAEAAQYEKNKQFDKLTQHMQNFPPDFKSAFDLNMKGAGMTADTVTKMKARLSELTFKNTTLTARGSFHFGENSENVYHEPNSSGDWIYSYLPPRQYWNRKTVVTEADGYTRHGTEGVIYAPETSVANKFIVTLDPVKYDKENIRGGKSSRSAFAISVYYKRDYSIDPDSKPRDEWVSQDYVATYCKKTDMREEAYEEVLKVAILYGAMIYPESNDAGDFMLWLRRKGYDGYLLRDMDERGRLSNVPGRSATAENKNDMFVKMADFLNHNVSRMKHAEIIKDWLSLRSIDDLTNRDLAAATGWAQVAAAQRTVEFYQEINQVYEIKDSFDFIEV